MQGVLLEVPEALLEQRRRTGVDRFDECWDGVLHMPPPPNELHGSFGTDLLFVLVPIARRRGLRPYGDGTGLFRSGDDYRVPDQQYVRPEQRSARGVELPAELVVELRSPHDETYAKLDWYAAGGVREVLIVDPPTRAVELFVLRDGRLLPLSPDADGAVRSAVLGVTFRTAAGPVLRVEWEGGSAEV